MGYAHDFDTLYVLRAVMGVSEALYIPAGLALIADYHQGSTRSLAVGIHMTRPVRRAGARRVRGRCRRSFSWQHAFQGFGLLVSSTARAGVAAAGASSRAEIAGGRAGPRRHKCPGLDTRTLSLLLGTVSFW